jgi:hypothetical protein
LIFTGDLSAEVAVLLLCEINRTSPYIRRKKKRIEGSLELQTTKNRETCKPATDEKGIEIS